MDGRISSSICLSQLWCTYSGCHSKTAVQGFLSYLSGQSYLLQLPKAGKCRKVQHQARVWAEDARVQVWGAGDRRDRKNLLRQCQCADDATLFRLLVDCLMTPCQRLPGRKGNKKFDKRKTSPHHQARSTASVAVSPYWENNREWKLSSRLLFLKFLQQGTQQWLWLSILCCGPSDNLDTLLNGKRMFKYQQTGCKLEETTCWKITEAVKEAYRGSRENHEKHSLRQVA